MSRESDWEAKGTITCHVLLYKAGSLRTNHDIRPDIHPCNHPVRDLA
jgi:hypothetical protein